MGENKNVSSNVCPQKTPNKFLTATAERVDTDDTSQAVSLSSRSSSVIKDSEDSVPSASPHVTMPTFTATLTLTLTDP